MAHGTWKQTGGGGGIGVLAAIAAVMLLMAACAGAARQAAEAVAAVVTMIIWLTAGSAAFAVMATAVWLVWRWRHPRLAPVRSEPQVHVITDARQPALAPPLSDIPGEHLLAELLRRMEHQ